jgi:bifunctional enzyme CysN/CysC
VDARKGVLTQTRRHSFIVKLLGIRHVVVAINKMDLVDWSQSRYDEIVAEYQAFAQQIGLTGITCIPLSALRGDNMLERSAASPWYTGPALMEHLETVVVDEDLASLPFRLPVQWVNRPNSDFRGFSGLIASGQIASGDRIRALPSGKEALIARIVTHDGDLPLARAGQSITLTLDHEIDVSRGDVLVAAGQPAGVADQFQATIIWMHEEPMLPGRPYLLKIGARTVSATLATPKHKVNVNTLEHLAAKQLELNEIGVCTLNLDRAIAFDPYAENRETGGFILIDKLNNDTVGAGLLEHALRRADNIHWQALDVNRQARAAQKGQKACALWFTGLSGSGKSTKSACTRWDVTPTCSTGTTSATASTRTSASPMPTAWRTSGASPKWPNSWSMRDSSSSCRSSRPSAPNAAWRASCSRPVSSSRCSSTRRLKKPSAATRRASTRRRVAAN